MAKIEYSKKFNQYEDDYYFYEKFSSSINFRHTIIFNGKPLPSFVIIKSIDTQILSDISNTKVKSNVGYRHKKIEFGSKIISIKFSLERNSTLPPFDQQQELLKWVRGNDWKESELILPDNPDAHYMAICNNKIELANSDLESEGTIEFLVCNPYRIGNAKITLNIKELQALSREIGSENIKPKIIFDITEDCEEIKLSIKNSYYDNYIRFKHNFLIGDRLTIDMETKKITLNGEIKMQILTLDSKFHEFNKDIKDNVYTLEVGNADVSIELHEVYL